MALKVEIPTPMRDLVGNQRHVEVAGTTVQEALDDLVRQYPPIGPKLFLDGQLRQYINVFVNDEDIRFLDEMATAVKEGEIVALIPAVAGG